MPSQNDNGGRRGPWGGGGGQTRLRFRGSGPAGTGSAKADHADQWPTQRDRPSYPSPGRHRRMDDLLHCAERLRRRRAAGHRGGSESRQFPTHAPQRKILIQSPCLRVRAGTLEYSNRAPWQSRN